MSLLAFWEEGNSVQTEAVDFGRSYYLLLAIFGAEVAAGCFWRADLSLADAVNLDVPRLKAQPQQPKVSELIPLGAAAAEPKRAKAKTTRHSRSGIKVQ